MDLLLHIGCEKTGTTSLQGWLDQHDEALAQRGVVYARSLGRPNNRRISYLGLEPGTPDLGLRREGVTDAATLAALQAQIAAELATEAAEARAAGCGTFVVSNEHCHSRLKTPAAVRCVAEALGGLFDRIEIVCFLRPQIDVCLSLASTMSRHGRVIDSAWIDDQMRGSRPYYALGQLLTRWAGAFGAAALTPVASRRHPDTITWFEARLEVANLTLARRPAENGAIDYRTMAVINALAAHGIDREIVARALGALLGASVAEHRLTLGRAAAQRLQARFDADNAALCAAWPSIRPDDLQPDWQLYPLEGSIDALDAAALDGPALRGAVATLHAGAMQRRLKPKAAARRQAAMAPLLAALGLPG